ncbi:IMP dehydrogenase [Puniceicoccales bacterium CK1056]|uniref:IMP dehydrogenase n=1 Tax=Oceanipulchritudo coccoides TaxID=2706888 RepID=A0A6B2M2V6_9BACT|nr:IMP dehydrogenase [Oceanipulchritudo coccoides]NDV62736.1 IMP dehydrogenase [Oceanipulchritudo coccoides]
MAHATHHEDTDSQFYKNADTFFSDNARVGLTFDDITLATRYSEILPRLTKVDMRLSEQLVLNIPLISADMDTVTEAEMAAAMARNGGLGIIHYNMPEKRQIREVAKVKNDVHGLIQEPIAISPESHIADVLEMIEIRGFKFHTFPVVDIQNKLVGLLRGRVVKSRYRGVKVADAMTPLEQVFTIQESDIADDPIGAADRFFNDHMGIHKLIVLDKGGHLKGLFTMSDIERIREEESRDVKPSRDASFQLVCGAAISATRTPAGELDRDRILEHASNLVSEGIDALAVSTAHGHSAGVGDVVKLLRGEFKDLSLIAGNVTSAEGVEYLSKCGADAVKVGQGPGSICTTRIVAGVGIPQLTALYVCSKAAEKTGTAIIADGGITKSGDIVKALTLGNAVMCGSLFAGCREAPGSILEINGKLFKQYRGMGSLTAMKAGSAARYGHESHAKKSDKVAAEGIEALKEVSGSLDDTLRQLVGGLQSGMGYLGASNLAELRSRARYIRVSPAGQRESSPHDVVELKTTKED